MMGDFMVKVSVVVPVYNVEDYLRECLDSIVNQTLKDIEIICVNDGSPDNSLDILYEYQEKDNRIIVISQDNGGHAVATNVGMRKASGKYLFLMDSDDILELNALKDTYDLAEEKNVDFVLFKAINYDDINDEYYETENYSMNKVYARVKDDVFTYEDIDDLIFNMSVTPWSKLYRRDFIEKHEIIFPEGLIFEDNVFFWKVLFNAERICFLDQFLFKRRWYPFSSTTNGDLRFLSSISVINLVWDVFNEFDLFEKHKVDLYRIKVFTFNMRLQKIKPEFKDDFFSAMKNDFISMVNNKELYEDFMKNAPYKARKIFEHVLISKNSKEFNNIRNTYSSQMKNNDLSNQLSELKLKKSQLSNM